MLLSEFCREIYCIERSIGPAAHKTQLKIISAFSRFLGHLATLEDLPQTNHWLMHCSASLKPGTVQSYRAQILSIWRLAREVMPDQVSRVKLRERPRWQPTPWAWSETEMRLLLAAASNLRGNYGEVPRSTWWRLFLQVAWQTGLRRTDLSLLRRSQIRPSFAICQHKTGKIVVCGLDPQTIAEVGQLPGDQPFKLPMSEESIRQHWLQIVAAAGVRRGPFKFVRKSSGNYSEEQLPGAGCRLLGNERRVFDAHYLDPTRLPGIPRPPVL